MIKIAIVEDDQAISQMYRMKFETEGYAVETAENGRIGLQMIEKIKPDIVLLDLMMPVMSGWEFLDAQKQDVRFASHQVVTISAVNPNQSIEDPTPLETAGSIQKPFSLGKLWEKVAEFCGPPPSAADQSDLTA